MGLALSTWIERGETVTLAGATGLGKTWLACALAQYASRQGRSALYLRVPRLAEELRILHGVIFALSTTVNMPMMVTSAKDRMAG